jgi:molecular chaperone HscB
VLQIDLEQLERKFHDLSRRYHPDYHTNRAPDQREHSLRMTALVNDAYRTLRDPTRRAEYLVRAQGLTVDGSKVGGTLLAEVFEINEGLEELRAAREGGGSVDSLLESILRYREQIAAKRHDYERKLEAAFAEWDRLVTDSAPEEERRQYLTKLADIISHSAYIRNLEREIEQEVTH